MPSLSPWEEGEEMQALSDDRRVDALETKVDAGFARMDKGFAEMREDLNQMRGQTFAGIVAVLSMWLTMILGFAGIVIAMLAHG